MKFAPECNCVNSSSLQLSRERLQFTVRIRERFVTVLGHDDLPAAHAEFESFEPRRNAANPFIRVVQAAQCMWMMSLVQPRRVQQHVKSSQRPLGLIGPECCEPQRAT